MIDMKLHMQKKGKLQVEKKLLKVMITLLLFIIMLYLNIKEFPVFLSIIEICNVVLATSIAVVVLNTYGLSNDRGFPLLGIAYIFISIFLFLNIIIISFENQLIMISSEMIIIALYMESSTFFVKGILLERKINIYICSVVYGIFSILLLFEVFHWHLLIDGIVSKIGSYYFNKVSLIIIAAIFATSMLVFYYKRKCLEEKTFQYIMTALLFKTLSTFILSFVLEVETNNLIGMVAYMAAMLSSYFLYQGIVIGSLKKPYTEISMQKNTLEAILESTSEGILVVDNKGEVLHYNKNFIEMWKLSGEIVETKDRDRMLTFLKEQLLNADDFFKTLETIENSSDNHRSTIDFKDGRIYDWFSKPLKINDRISGRVWDFRDITQAMNMIKDLRIKEKELEKRKTLYKKLIEILPDAVFVSIEGKVVMTNKQGLRLSGYDNYQEIEGEYYHDVIKIHPDYMKTVEERLNRLMSEETTVDFSERKLIGKDDTLIDAEVAAASFKQDEEYYMLTVIRDLREQRKAEKLQQEVIEKEKEIEETKENERLKTQFFSNISHELKTPLNIIWGSIQLLNSLHEESKECPYYNKCNRYLSIMKQNCFRLLRLINNLIDITKIDNGYLKLKLESYNIIDIVENITQSVADYASTKNISLIFDTDIEEKVLVFDPDKMERILLNLLSNAIKFTESEGTIKVNIYERESGIAISVKDSGIGIPLDKLDEVFERFKQVGSALHHKNEGSGIGLSLTKALVEAHRGEIFVKSRLGQGTEFIIELPDKSFDESINLIKEAVPARGINIEKINIEFADIYSTN